MPSPRYRSSDLRLYTNAIYLWLSFIVPSALGIFFWIIAARLYPAEAVGVGAAAFSAVVILSEVAHLGFGFGLIHWLPSLDGSKKIKVLNAAFTMTIIVALFTVLIFLLGVDLFIPALRSLTREKFCFAFFIVIAPFVGLYSLLAQTFIALGDTRYTLLQNVAATVLRIALVTALSSLLPSFGIIVAIGLSIVGR